VFCLSVKFKLAIPLLCVCVHSAWKGYPRNDLYCVERDVKPYSLTHSSTKKFPYRFRITFHTKLIFWIFYLENKIRIMLFCNLFMEQPWCVCVCIQYDYRLISVCAINTVLKACGALFAIVKMPWYMCHTVIMF